MSLGSHHAGGLAGFLGQGARQLSTSCLASSPLRQAPSTPCPTAARLRSRSSSRLAPARRRPPSPAPWPPQRASSGWRARSRGTPTAAAPWAACSGAARRALRAAAVAARQEGREREKTAPWARAAPARQRMRGRAGARARGALGPDLFRLLRFGWLRFAARLLRFKGVGRRLRRKQ